MKLFGHRPGRIRACLTLKKQKSFGEELRSFLFSQALPVIPGIKMIILRLLAAGGISLAGNGSSPGCPPGDSTGIPPWPWFSPWDKLSNHF
jgi:hypothetical protein